MTFSWQKTRRLLDATTQELAETREKLERANLLRSQAEFAAMQHAKEAETAREEARYFEKLYTESVRQHQTRQDAINDALLKAIRGEVETQTLQKPENGELKDIRPPKPLSRIEKMRGGHIRKTLEGRGLIRTPQKTSENTQ